MKIRKIRTAWKAVQHQWKRTKIETSTEFQNFVVFLKENNKSRNSNWKFERVVVEKRCSHSEARNTYDIIWVICFQLDYSWFADWSRRIWRSDWLIEAEKRFWIYFFASLPHCGMLLAVQIIQELSSIRKENLLEFKVP